MKRIATCGNTKVWLYNCDHDEPLQVPFDSDPFVGVVWNNKPNFVSPSIIKSMLQNNCKFFLSGGYECEHWELMTDQMHSGMFPDFKPPANEQIVTTSHENETIDDMLWFALNKTKIDNENLDNVLIVQINQEFSDQKLARIIDEQWVPSLV